MKIDFEKYKEPALIWFNPFIFVFACFLLPFSFFFLADYFSSGTNNELIRLILDPDGLINLGLLGTSAAVITEVLGITITVIAIIVQLSANRYTSQVTKLFMSDRVNFVVLGFMVIASLHCIWTAASFHADFVPIVGARWALTILSASLLMLLPYFHYVFKFLQPGSILARIRRQIDDNLDLVPELSDPRPMDRCKAKISQGIAQVTDIALNSIAQKDRGLAMTGSLILREVVLDNLAAKARMPQQWFKISQQQGYDPDFVTLSRQGLDDVEDDHIWLEYKVFKQYHQLFAGSLHDLRDLNNLIAMCYRDIGIAASKAKDDGLRALVIKNFNSVLRTTLNGTDVRTAYNVLHQYRQFAAQLITDGDTDELLTVFNHFKYYGLLFDNRGIGFILETVAYDLFLLMCRAHLAKLSNEDELLSVFLEVDQPPDVGESDVALRGVRKAQTMLAVFYLNQDEHEKALRIAEDMTVEPQDRLLSIRDEILAAERSFWEITDRGVNFDHLDVDLHPKLEAFFELCYQVRGLKPPPKKVVTTPPEA